MDACYYSRSVQCPHDEAADSERKSKQPLDSSEYCILSPYEDRSDNCKCKISCHEHADERCYEQVQYLRYDLVQLFLYHRKKPYCDHNRDYMSLVTYHVNVIQAEEYRLCLLHSVGGNIVCILQCRIDHDHTDDRSKIRVGTESLRRRESNQDLQKCICCIAEQICKYVERTARVHIDKAVIYHEVQRIHDTHEETARHDSRDDRYENIAQQLDRSHKYILLLCSGFFCLGL